MRPSSRLRATRLLVLIEGLETRELGVVGAATLLECSPSAARTYLLELLDAGIITTSAVRGSGKPDKTVYCLGNDLHILEGFQIALERAASCDDTATAAPVTWRDPLVWALFGGVPSTEC